MSKNRRTDCKKTHRGQSCFNLRLRRYIRNPVLLLLCCLQFLGFLRRNLSLCFRLLHRPTIQRLLRPSRRTPRRDGISDRIGRLVRIADIRLLRDLGLVDEFRHKRCSLCRLVRPGLAQGRGFGGRGWFCGCAQTRERGNAAWFRWAYGGSRTRCGGWSSCKCR